MNDNIENTEELYTVDFETGRVMNGDGELVSSEEFNEIFYS